MTKKRFQKLMYSFMVRYNKFYEGKIGENLKKINMILISPEEASKNNLSYSNFWNIFKNLI